MVNTFQTKIRYIFSSVIVLMLGYVVYIATIAGELRTLEPHFDGSCRIVTGVPGAEDIVILADGSGAILSSQDRHAELAGASPAGSLYYYSLTDTASQPVNLTPDAPANFRPHGIGLYQDSETRLFVVNHPRANIEGDLPGTGPAHSIEVYRYQNRQLNHVRTVADPALLFAPNDVAPVSRDSFYVTNDHGSAAAWQRKLEDYLRLARAHILFYNGAEFSRLPGTYRYANGIIAAADGSQVYMSAPADRTVHIFDRDGTTNMLTPAAEIFVNTGGDNINLDREGNLWIGAHPKLLSFARYVHNPDKPSPSQVLHLVKDADQNWQIEETMLTDGSHGLASSVAARYHDRLLVGGVFGQGFLDCTMAPAEGH